MQKELQRLTEQLNRIERITLSCNKEVLTMDDVTILTGISKSRLYRLTSTKKIPHYKPKGRRAVYFKRTEIENWLLQE